MKQNQFVLRKGFIILFFCLKFIYAISQTSTPKVLGSIHRFKQTAVVTECTSLGENIAAPETPYVNTVPYGAKFRITRITADGNYVINFFEWSGPKKQGNGQQKNRADTLNERFVKKDKEPSTKINERFESRNTLSFKLTPQDYNLNCEEVERRGKFIVYASTTLFRVRPGREKPMNNYPVYSDISNNINIGAMAGWRIKPNQDKDFAFNILTGLAFSSIPVDSLSTQGIITSKTNANALTPSFGFVAEAGDFQFGVSLGIDILSGEPARTWIYRRRPWIGFGFGYSIFQTRGTPKNEVK